MQKLCSVNNIFFYLEKMQNFIWFFFCDVQKNWHLRLLHTGE